ncbi:hypothetical protein B0T22DRAFT_128698 [Podospora appendiculata]|uniref:Uncharacterized protein n=1 Tax=Podospora appendiculata TaxID=314037 RepID=A0AAE0X7H1_9PEZI|nr:hypothetical protein B0T22DRAFT_128698 [Podospora appendiculata]
MVSTPEPEVICVDQPAGQKRSRAETEPAEDPNFPTTPKLVILHFDAIIDGRAAVTTAVRKVFASLQPTTPAPSPARILSVFANGAPLLASKFQALVPTAALPDADALRAWTDAYLETYDREGKPLLAPFPDARAFLTALAARDILIAITTNHRDFAKAFLAAHAMADLPDFLVRRAAAYAARPALFRDFFDGTLVPSYAAKRRGAGELRPGDHVLVVSCTPFNLRTARTIGARACWVRKPGVTVEPEAGGLDADTIVVGDLAELGKRIFGGRKGADAEEDLKVGNDLKMGNDLKSGNDLMPGMMVQDMGAEQEQQNIGGEAEKPDVEMAGTDM